MLCDRKIKVTVNGLGYLRAIGSGNPLTEESFSDQEYASYYGRLQAVIAGRDRAGKVKVVLTAKDVVSEMIEITVKEFSCICFCMHAKDRSPMRGQEDRMTLKLLIYFILPPYYVSSRGVCRGLIQAWI